MQYAIRGILELIDYQFPMVRNIDRMPVPQAPDRKSKPEEVQPPKASERTLSQKRDDAARGRAEILHIATEEGGDLSEIIPETPSGLVADESPRNLKGHGRVDISLAEKTRLREESNKAFLAEAKAAGVNLSDYEDKKSKKLVTEAGDPWQQGVTMDDKARRYAEKGRTYLQGAKEAGIHSEEMDPTQGQKFTEDFGRAEHDPIADRRRRRGKEDLKFIKAARELHDAGKIDRGTLDPTTGQVFTRDSGRIERAQRRNDERTIVQMGRSADMDPTRGKIYTEETGRQRGLETKDYDVSSYGDTAAKIEQARNTRYKMEEVDEDTPLVLSPEERSAKSVASQLPEEYDSSYEFMAADSRPGEPMTLSAEQRRNALERARLNEAAERGEDEEEILRLAEEIQARVRRERAAREARLRGENLDERKTG